MAKSRQWLDLYLVLIMTEEKSATSYLLLCGCNVLSCGADLPPEGNAERLLPEDVCGTKVVDDLGRKEIKCYSICQNGN